MYNTNITFCSSLDFSLLPCFYHQTLVSPDLLFGIIGVVVGAAVAAAITITEALCVYHAEDNKSVAVIFNFYFKVKGFDLEGRT